MRRGELEVVSDTQEGYLAQGGIWWFSDREKVQAEDMFCHSDTKQVISVSEQRHQATTTGPDDKRETQLQLCSDFMFSNIHFDWPFNNFVVHGYFIMHLSCGMMRSDSINFNQIECFSSISKRKTNAGDEPKLNQAYLCWSVHEKCCWLIRM